MGDGILLKFDVWKDIVSQSYHYKSWPDLVTLGGVWVGNLKSWKTLWVEGSGWNLVGKTSTSPRYVITITGMDPLSLGYLGGGFNSEKTRKNEVFLTYEWVIESQWNLIFIRISCLKALILNPEQIWWHWGELRGGNLKLGKHSDIFGTDLLYLGELGGGLTMEN